MAGSTSDDLLARARSYRLRGEECRTAADNMKTEQSRATFCHVGMDADCHGDGRAAASAQRLAERHLIGIVEALAAEPLGLVDAEEALAAHLLEELMRREDAGLLPLVDIGVDLGLAEAG